MQNIVGRGFRQGMAAAAWEEQCRGVERLHPLCGKVDRLELRLDQLGSELAAGIADVRDQTLASANVESRRAKLERRLGLRL